MHQTFIISLWAGPQNIARFTPIHIAKKVADPWLYEPSVEAHLYANCGRKQSTVYTAVAEVLGRQLLP